jgi:phosphate transport system substrate-binding protein
MRDRRKLARQIAGLLALLLFFVLLNGSVYLLLTRRLGNNFSGASQLKMVDVGAYLPHEEGSRLAHVETQLRLTGELPVLDGAAALVPVYAAVIDNLYPVGSVTYEGGVFSDDNYYGENFAPDSKMQYHNTVRGFQALLDGSVDLFFSAAPSAEQRQQAAEAGVELVCVPIGLEAFVFFVNSQNPVDSLTAEQLRGVYAGEIRNWSALGGPDLPINPVTRVAGSGSQTVMEHFMGDKAIAKKSPLALFGASIGYSFRFYLQGLVGNAGVTMLAVDGVSPSAEHIRDRSYPLVYPFYVIYRADNRNGNIPLLVDWLLSEDGQALLEQTGYVGLGEAPVS